ncbi:MAG: DUF2795 domain-containing protein [Anaerolineae bacterium]|jgi:hypothetical protein
MSEERGKMQEGMSRMGGLNPDMIKDYLSDVSFPVSKDSLIQTARQHGAPDMVISFLQRLPDKQYKSQDEVTQEVQGGMGTQGFGGSQSGRGM